MNAPLLPEILMGPQPIDQPALPLATEGIQRYVWHSAFGAILIEARDGAAYVNGKRVMSLADMRGDGDAV
jgi:hypothetical protein